MNLDLNKPLPKAGIFYLFVALPIFIACIMAVTATLITRLLGSDFLSGNLIAVALFFFLAGNGLRALLGCVDWFEARKKNHG